MLNLVPNVSNDPFGSPLPPLVDHCPYHDMKLHMIQIPIGCDPPLPRTDLRGSFGGVRGSKKKQYILYPRIQNEGE